jgi:hypothetical protein
MVERLGAIVLGLQADIMRRLLALTTLAVACTARPAAAPPAPPAVAATPPTPRVPRAICARTSRAMTLTRWCDEIW